MHGFVYVCVCTSTSVCMSAFIHMCLCACMYSWGNKKHPYYLIYSTTTICHVKHETVILLTGKIKLPNACTCAHTCQYNHLTNSVLLLSKLLNPPHYFHFFQEDFVHCYWWQCDTRQWSYLHDGLGCLLTQVVDGVLVTQPIRALHRVVEVILPLVIIHTRQCSVDSTLKHPHSHPSIYHF